MTRPWIAAAIALLVTSCGASTAGEEAAPIKVFAAASLSDVLPRLDPEPQYQFAGSDQLALQIEEGAPADVYASASPEYAMDLYSHGLVTEPKTFATNRLVLIVPQDNPANIRSVADLAEPDVRLVVGAPGVPVGEYAREALHVLGAERVLSQVVSEEQDAKGVVSKVALGEADAGFVYATDVATVGDRVKALDLPAGAQPPIEYVVAAVIDGSRRAAADAFIERLLSDEGRKTLDRAGFGLP